MPDTDYYALLGVTPTSSPEEITHAFHRLARKYHPDVNPHDSGADERFKLVNEAYQTLSDPVRRAQYDQESASSQFTPGSMSSPAENDPAKRVVVHQKSVVIPEGDVEEIVSNLTSALGDTASSIADELRGALRDFAAQLDQVARTASDNPGHRGRQGSPPAPRKFSPPPRNVGPTGRPPGRKPKL
jgi:curved DNA-binding protein CbpA